MSPKKLYLIDGMSHIYRAYYAIRNLSNSKGLPTNATYGFTSMLRKLIEEQKPDYLGVAFDLEGPTVRHEKLESYKATRKPMPDDLVQQIPYIRRVCEVFAIPVIGLPGYEADDVIGTLATEAVKHDLMCVIVTGDKDMLQLVSESVKVLDMSKGGSLLLDSEKVIEKMGVRPEQVPDLLGLAGDSSDNIPGAPGIGAKGARDLIQTFGSLEGCLQNWSQVKRKTYQESLRDNVEIIRTSRELATIHKNLPLKLDLESLALSTPERSAAFELFAELEFKTLMREFLDRDDDDAARAKCLRGTEAADFVEGLRKQPGIFFVLSYREEPFSRKSATAACIQGETGEIVVVDLEDDLVASSWGRLLEAPGLKKICWDAKLCMLSLDTLSIRLNSDVADVMIMAFLAAPHIGDYTLRRWALEQLHWTLPEDSERSVHAAAEFGLEQQVEYLSRRLAAVRRLYDLLQDRLESLELRRLFDEIETPLIPVLADMERAGVKVDREILQQMSTTMEREIVDLTSKIHQAAGLEFNINSPKQLGEVLFERLNLPTSKRTRKTRGYSTDQSVLEELAESYEIPRLVLEYRQLTKLKSTYVDALPMLIHPATGRIHTNFNQTGAATGRLSSSEPNLQNIPVRTDLGRLIRGAFIPEEGNLLISADYSQVELRVLAHLSEDEVLTDAFRRDQDIHEHTAREVFGPIEGAKSAEYRRRAKVINFGIVYGLSSFGLAQRLGIGREEAQAFIDAYFRRYQGVRKWIDNTLEETRRTGQVRTMFGRIRPIPEILSKDHNSRQFAERTAINSPIQGTAADLIKLAMINIHKALQSGGLSARILIQVHDELVLEVSEGDVSETRELVREKMEGVVSLNVPLRVDLNVGKNWKDLK